MEENDGNFAAPIDDPRDAGSVVALLEEIRDRLDHTNELLDEICGGMREG